MKTVDGKQFISEYTKRFKLELSAGQSAGLELLLLSMNTDVSIEDARWGAYMLATVKHECANTWLPITEYGKHAYFDKYNAHTPLGRRLGNTQLGDGFRYRGRGFVQITGRGNYARLSKMLFKDNRMVENPDLALVHTTAYAIMSRGMVTGAFTGKKLSDYIAGNKCDYVNARKIINGVDKAEWIAQNARLFEACLKASVLKSGI